MKPRHTYGAEDLEVRYPRHVLAGLCVASGLLLGVTLIPLMKVLRQPSTKAPISMKATRVINYVELAAPPPIDLERKPPEPLLAPPEVKTVKYLPPVVKPDEEVPDYELLPTREEMRTAAIGTAYIEGVDSVYVPSDPVELKPEPEPRKMYETFTFVEVMPEFRGGAEALQRYLAEQVQYPATARESQIEGTVYISFVVEADGSISEVEIVRSVHPLLDAEARRVIESMPRWIPGKQNNLAVRVRFTLPISFRLRRTG